jgi:hypothetical protein
MKKPLVWWLGAIGVVGVVVSLVHQRERAQGTPPAGASPLDAPSLEAACVDGSTSRCPLGSKLVVRLRHPKGDGYLAAYAEREGDAPEKRIWYYPTKDGVPLYFAKSDGQQIVPNGIVLGPEHVPGRYSFHFVFSGRPLVREEAVRPELPGVSRASFSFEVTR